MNQYTVGFLGGMIYTLFWTLLFLFLYVITRKRKK